MQVSDDHFQAEFLPDSAWKNIKSTKLNQNNNYKNKTSS
jgi:hypothetical protein